MATALPKLGNPRDVYRYRKQRGVNLGAWFVLERWISGAPFGNSEQWVESDLQVARLIQSKALPPLNAHWDSWIRDEDWQWIVDHGYNTVRLPVGYYHLSGVDPNVVANTDFAGFIDIFKEAWGFIDRAITTAARFNIGVLVDLHAAPGAQNPDAHSGVGDKAVRLWDGSNRQSATFALRILLSQLIKHDNIVGVELLNEPNDRTFLPDWYSATLSELRSISSDIPLYIADAWHSEIYAPFAGARTDFTVVDQHLYRCFTPEDRAKYGDQHAAELRNITLNQLRGQSKQARGNFIIGEFSAALGGQPPGSNAGEQDRQRRVFAQAQLDIYEQVCGGWFFWTLKRDSWDAGWALKDATRAEIMPAFVGKRKKGVPDDGKREQAKTAALNAHTNFWRSRMPKNEHWRFELGFLQGWNDGKLFFSFPGQGSLSEIGYKGEWNKRRIAEHVAEKGTSEFVWEFEHGIQQGYDAIFALV